MAMAALLGLAGCHEAYGGGFIGAPLDGGPIGVFNARAKFGFSFQCDAGVKGELAYHDTSTKGPFPGLRFHGSVDNVLIEVVPDDPATPEDETVVEPAAKCEEIAEAPAAHFEGSYRSLERRLLSKPPGRFNVLVFDQGEPSRLRGDFTGDGFAIDSRAAPTTATPGAAISRAATSRRSDLEGWLSRPGSPGQPGGHGFECVTVAGTAVWPISRALSVFTYAGVWF
jgi:hypothetical protein